MHYQIEVFGKVQGVWFRKYTKELADQIGVNGFVKNTSRGTVYIETLGSEEQIDLFVIGIKKGSPLSEVNKVTIEKQDSKDFHFNDFKITR